MLTVRHLGISFAALMISAGFASAQVITSNPTLPPNTGSYMTPQQVHADYSGQGLQVVLSQLSHEPFNTGPGSVKYTDNTTTGTETDTFNSQATGMVSVNGSPDTPFTLTGPVSVDVANKVGNVTGTFNTQMTSMDLTGNILGYPVEIALDPNNATYGQTSITNIGGGMYQISSFFDIFTELSLDGGNTFIPQSNGPTLVTLVPEPASTAVLGGGALFLLRRRRRAAGI